MDANKETKQRAVDGAPCESEIGVKATNQPKRIEFALDLETLSLSPTAAIIAVAVKPFFLNGDDVITGEDLKPHFFMSVDATSCVMLGMDVDAATCKWWAGQSTEAKAQFRISFGIDYAMQSLVDYVRGIISANDADDVRVWCQGTDFDIPILRNAMRLVFGDSYERAIPWRYNDVVDARTFIREGVRLLGAQVQNPYDAIPKMDGYVKHSALSDVERLIHDVRWVNCEIKTLIIRS